MVQDCPFPRLTAHKALSGTGMTQAADVPYPQGPPLREGRTATAFAAT